ncbi:MAG: VCBS repeat-containing protein [bacterium]|nr:VCBS repeat-containing protein [bacterium]
MTIFRLPAVRIRPLVAALAAALVPLCAGAAPDFAAPFREFSAGIEAVALAPGDFDGDGLLDAVVSVLSPGSDLVFMRQNPDHTFTNAGSWSPPDFLYELAAGDFDGDGNLDVAGLSYGDSLRVLFGDGAGGVAGLVGRASPPSALTLARADLDGGSDDLVVLSYSWSQLQTYIGDGGAVTPVTTYTTLVSPSALGIGDLDGDGHDDIVVAHEFIEVSEVLYTDGAGGLSGSLVLSYSPVYGSAAAVCDFDGDGHNDILIGAADGTGAGVYLYAGAAVFTPPSYYGGAVGSANFSALCGDLDGDGDADVVLGGTSSTLLINSGAGTFIAPDSALPSGVHNFGEMHLADIDADGALDLLTVGNYGATLLTARGNGDGTFEEDLLLPAGYAEQALLADVDGDGDGDLVSINSNFSAIEVRLRSGSLFGPETTEYFPDQPSGLAAGDFDGDSYPDFATVTAASGDVQVLMNDGAGAVGPASTLGTGEHPIDVAVGDLDGDGLDDIVAVCTGSGEFQASAAAAATNDGFSVFLSTGSGFSLPTFVSAAGTCPLDVAIADVTDDGLADLIGILACSGEVAVFPGLGGGAFGAPTSLPTAAYPSAVAVRDLDGDSLLDIVALTSSGWLHTFHNAGGGTFDPPVDAETGYGSNHLAIADFDLDGLPDAAALSFASVVNVHAGLAGGEFGERQGFGVFSGASGLIVEDFDADGAPDLLVPGHAEPSLQFLRNRHVGATAVGDGAVFTAGILDVREPSPNPASGGMRLEFRLGAARRVAVDVFDARGRLVRRLQDPGTLGAGAHLTTWDLKDRDGARTASGVYFARVTAGPEAVTRKVFVTR